MSASVYRSGGDEDEATAFLNALRGHGPLPTATALFVAHPDDESIALAGSMVRFQNLTLIHATNGAPIGGDMPDEIAARRQSESEAALQAALAQPCHLKYELTDGRLVDTFDRLVDSVTRDLAAAAIVITHAFEGGHIDHDACALAVQLACDRLRANGCLPPARIEFAGYHSRRGRVRAGTFWPQAGVEETVLRLDEGAVRRREAALACHRSQEGNLRMICRVTEMFRPAPQYALGAPPPPAATLYAPETGALLRSAVLRLGAEDPA